MKIEIIKKSLALLDKKQRQNLRFLTAVSIFLNLIDFFAVTLTGVAVLTMGNNSSIYNNPLVTSIKTLINKSSFLQNTTNLFSFVLFLFLIKTLLSVLLNNYMYQVLTSNMYSVFEKLTNWLFNFPNEQVRLFSKQRLVYALTTSLDSAVIVTLSSYVTIFSDLALAILLIIPIFIMKFEIGLFIIIYFGVVYLILSKVIYPKALKLSQTEAQSSVKTNNLLTEMIDGSSEIYVYGKMSIFIKNINLNRLESNRSFGHRLMLQTIPKVLFELAIVLGVIGYFFLSKLLSTPASETLPSLILLFAVAARLTPGLLRMQTALLVIKSNSGLSDEVLALHQELKSDSKWPPEKIHYDGTSQEFVPDLVLKDLTFRYIANQPLIDNINLEVKCGERIAIIGETGAGKSTLLKLLLGLKEPISGSVKISNVDAKQIHKLWPNSIAYIPQEVTVFDGSLLQNVTLNFDLNNYSSNKLIGEILSKVGLDKFLRNFESTTDVILGTNGVILSGGEKQKLGLARALFAKSKILILDEPTASLDQQSKLEFVNIINLLSKEMTVVIVTHENVLNYQLDKIYELRNGIIEVSHHNS